jgi:hypothetical protein
MEKQGNDKPGKILLKDKFKQGCTTVKYLKPGPGHKTIQSCNKRIKRNITAPEAKYRVL